MDPTAVAGELLALQPNDLTAFDAIGWNVAVPEPASFAALALGVAGLAASGRARRKAQRPPSTAPSVAASADR